MQELKHWAALSLVPNVGPVRFRSLEAHFGDLENALIASFGGLKAAGMDDWTARSIISHRGSITPDDLMDKLERSGARGVGWHDPDYPSRLLEIPDPPPILYMQGALTVEDEWAVAVVGTRKATAYGREVAATLSRDLAASGLTIVSGPACGIGSIAHRAAFDGGGRTIAVFGTASDTIYPSEHARLAQEILENGTLVSEYPLGTAPKAQNPPLRDRIISGMILGTLVIESGYKSGALITVSQDLKQNRDVFCFPGSIFSLVIRSTNALIQQRVKLVFSYKYILEELNLNAVAHQIEMRAVTHLQDENEARILEYITLKPLHIDEIRRKAGLPINMVSNVLAMMELKGTVKQIGGMHYTRLRETVEQYGN